MISRSQWTNRSVFALAGNNDPISVIENKARSLILEFMESGGTGPPFDPFELAKHLRLDVCPRGDVKDARTLFVDGRFRIEFNPNRPNSRVRYSISHEIIHTVFPDCKEKVRHRATHEEVSGDEWQLEMLCNIGASALLMPIGSFPDLQDENLSIDNILELRAKYSVSIESLLLRFIRLTRSSCAIFSASKIHPEKSQYKIDYAIPSASSAASFVKLQGGLRLPNNSVVSECTAIGFTAKSYESWYAKLDKFKVECIGIPPYPNQTFPRVMGIVHPANPSPEQQHTLNIIKGDATQPRGEGNKIIAFVVNDKTPRWGAGFALALKKKIPVVQKDFIAWAEENRNNLKLGNIHLCSIDYDLSAVQLICQHGYGESSKPRLRYQALRACLEKLAEIADKQNASVHLPRIGSGQAGGHWPVILEMVEESLCRRGISVTVYELPNEKLREDTQNRLFN